MNKTKKSFILHIDSLDILDDLSDEQAGRLLKAMRAFQKGEEFELDSLSKIAFSPFKNQFTRDNEKYDLTCKRRADAGSKGGLAKASKSKQMVANGSKSKQNLANLADSDNKNDNKSKSKSDNKSGNEVAILSQEVKPKNSELDWSVFGEISEEQIKEIKELRKSAKAPITQRVLNKLGKEFSITLSMGYTLENILDVWASKGWKGYEHSWFMNLQSSNGQTISQTPYDKALTYEVVK